MNLTRRALIGLASEAVLLSALPSMARAELEPSDVRSFGARGDGKTDDAPAFLKALASNATILVPEKLRFRVDSDVLVENRNLIVEGSIVGKGSLRFKGAVEIRGSGKISLNQSLAAFQFNSAGRFLVDGIKFEDCESLAAILIAPEQGDNIESLTIRNCQFERVNYGVLRQASESYGGIDSLTISQNNFRSLRGDAIEINCATKDKEITIEKNVISNVDNIGKKPFWGIGIGIAGRRYTEDMDPEANVKNFVVRDNRLQNLRQGIHVEAGFDFVIANNTITNVGPSFSLDSGLDVRGIVTYGCSNFQIVGNRIQGMTAGPAISVEYGVLNSRYVGSPRNYEVAQNTVSGIISCSAGGDNARVVIKKNRADGIRHRGQVDELLIQDNEISTGSSKPFDVDVNPQGWIAWLTSVKKSRIYSCGNRVGGAPFKIEHRRRGRVLAAEGCSAVSGRE
jgi:hypothetical protein